MADDPKFKKTWTLLSPNKSNKVFLPFWRKKKARRGHSGWGKGPEWAGARVNSKKTTSLGPLQVAAAGAFRAPCVMHGRQPLGTGGARCAAEHCADQPDAERSQPRGTSRAIVQVSAGREGDERGWLRGRPPQGWCRVGGRRLPALSQEQASRVCRCRPSGAAAGAGLQGDAAAAELTGAVGGPWLDGFASQVLWPTRAAPASPRPPSSSSSSGRSTGAPRAGRKRLLCRPGKGGPEKAPPSRRVGLDGGPSP